MGGPKLSRYLLFWELVDFFSCFTGALLEASAQLQRLVLFTQDCMRLTLLCAAVAAAVLLPEDPYEPISPGAPACAASTWGPSPCAFGSAMVLSSTTPWRASGSQPAAVFGLAQPSEVLTLSGLPPGATVAPSNPWTADSTGRWAITLSSADTTAPVNLTFTGASGKSVVLEDVLFGLTMLCSGQVRSVRA